MKKQLNITTLDELLDKQYGKRGTKKREEHEQGFEIFKLGATLHQIRKDQGLTKKEVADKCATTKKYISRIEDNPGSIRLSKLMRIIREGFGARLRIEVVS